MKKTFPAYRIALFALPRDYRKLASSNLLHARAIQPPGRFHRAAACWPRFLERFFGSRFQGYPRFQGLPASPTVIVYFSKFTADPGTFNLHFSRSNTAIVLSCFRCFHRLLPIRSGCFVSLLLSVLIIPPIDHNAISEKCTTYTAYSNMHKKNEYTTYSKMNIGGIFPVK